MVDQQKTEAEKIQDRLRTRVEDIRTRKDLSEEGRKRQLAKAHTEAVAEMRKVRAADETARAQREEKLLRTLFGNAAARDATSVVSFRDAQDRAECLTKPDEAAELLARARRSGDTLLAKAIGMKALNEARGGRPGAGSAWVGVLNQWAHDEPPAVDEALTELGQMHHANTGPRQLGRSLSYSVPTPPELRGSNIALLAQQADKDQAA